MEVHLDSTEGLAMRRGATTRANGDASQGRTAAPPAEVAAQTGQVLADREAEWLWRLARGDPASFAAIEPRGPRPGAGTRPISRSPGCWPRPATVPRWR